MSKFHKWRVAYYLFQMGFQIFTDPYVLDVSNKIIDRPLRQYFTSQTYLVYQPSHNYYLRVAFFFFLAVGFCLFLMVGPIPKEVANRLVAEATKQEAMTIILAITAWICIVMSFLVLGLMVSEVKKIKKYLEDDSYCAEELLTSEDDEIRFIGRLMDESSPFEEKVRLINKEVRMLRSLASFSETSAPYTKYSIYGKDKRWQRRIRE